MTSDQIYNLQLRKIELEEKKLKQQEQDKKKERELEEKKLKQQEQDKEKERELEEKKLKQQEQDKEKERELEEKKLKLQELKMEHEHAERMAEKLKTSPPTSQNFDILKHFSAVPPFQETDVDTYFLNFEKMAKCLRWPKEYWITLLQKVLTGRAREIFTHLSAEQSNDYDYVKDLILRSYQLNPEAY